MSINNQSAQYPIYAVDTIKFDSFIDGLDKEKPVIIFGSGAWGEFCYKYLRLAGFSVKFFIDNNPKKWEDKAFGVSIISPDTLKEIYNNEHIFVSPYEYGTQIKRQLLTDGYNEDRIYILPIVQQIGYIRLPSENRHIPADLLYMKDAPANPEATFITIAYNAPEHYIRRAVESIVRQTYTNWKYIIVDNAITDDTGKIIDEYASLDARIEIIKNEENFFSSEHRSEETINNMLEKLRVHITTEYVCIIDTDDYYEDSFLADTLALAKKHSADLVCTTIHTYWENELSASLEQMSYPPKSQVFNGEREKQWLYAFGDMKNNFFHNWWGKLAKKSIILNGLGFLHPVREAVDVCVTMAMLDAGNVVVWIDKILYSFTRQSKAVGENQSNLEYSSQHSALRAIIKGYFHSTIPHLLTKYNNTTPMSSTEYLYTFICISLKLMFSMFSNYVHDSIRFETNHTEIISDIEKALSLDYVQEAIQNKAEFAIGYEELRTLIEGIKKVEYNRSKT